MPCDKSLTLKQLRAAIGQKVSLPSFFKLLCEEADFRKELQSEDDWQACCAAFSKQGEVELRIVDADSPSVEEADEWVIIDHIIEDEEYLRQLGKDVWKRVVSYAEKRIADESQRQDLIQKEQVKKVLENHLEELHKSLLGFKDKFNSDIRSLQAQVKFLRIICLLELKSKGQPRNVTCDFRELPPVPQMTPFNSPKIVHHGVCCDGCKISPITGVRYKSVHKRNFDLCEKCYLTNKEKSEPYVALKEGHPSKANHLVHLSRGVVKPGQITKELSLVQHLHQWTNEFADLADILDQQ